MRKLLGFNLIAWYMISAWIAFIGAMAALLLGNRVWTGLCLIYALPVLLGCAAMALWLVFRWWKGLWARNRKA